MAKWMTDRDWAIGTLSEYQSTLQNRFDNPAQLMETFLVQAQDGSGQVFDSGRFCQELGIRDEHRALFEAWSEETYGVRPLVAGDCPERVAAYSPQPSLRHTSDRRDIEEWMREVDWSLGILERRFGLALERNFDLPSQIASAYFSGRTCHEERFFADIGATDDEDRCLHRILLTLYVCKICLWNLAFSMHASLAACQKNNS